MSITTKTGDHGTTSLWSGERVSKDHVRVEAYGSFDELDSFLAEAQHYVNDSNKDILERIQDILPSIMSELASTKSGEMSTNLDAYVTFLSSQIIELEKQVSIKSFVKKGKTLSSAKLDICNAITRRAERRIVSLMTSNDVKINPLILIFINRLSDLLFLMARVEEL